MEHCIYKLQVNKPITQTKLKKIVKKLLGKSDLKITDKKKYYEIIHMDRKYFKPKSYQKEKHDNVTVTVGILKKKHAKLHGAGIMDIFNKVKSSVTNLFSVKLDFNNKANKMLKEYGDKPIQKISIYRTPISNVYKTIINKVSLGGLDAMMKKVGYDKLFHMAIVLRIGDKNVLLEKNHVVTIDTTYKTSNETEICDVPYAINSTTLNNMLTKAVDTFGKEKIHRYSSFTNNCQMFVKDVLTANSLYNDTINTFVYQDFKEARDTLPITNTIANTVTDIVNVANKLSGGSKKEDEHVRELINKIHANYASRYVVGSGINPNVKKGFLDFVHGFLLPFKTIGSIIPEIGLPLQMAAGALDKIIPRGSGLSKRVKKVKL